MNRPDNPHHPAKITTYERLCVNDTRNTADAVWLQIYFLLKQRSDRLLNCIGLNTSPGVSMALNYGFPHHPVRPCDGLFYCRTPGMGSRFSAADPLAARCSCC